MKSTRYTLAILALAANGSILAQGATEADTFTCGEQLVDVGMEADEVLQLCGEPTTRLAEDQWVYERGPDQFTVTVYFEADNTVGRIDQTPSY